MGGTEFNEQGGSYWTAANSASGASAISYLPEMVWNDAAADSALWADKKGTDPFHFGCSAKNYIHKNARKTLS